MMEYFKMVMDFKQRDISPSSMIKILLENKSFVVELTRRLEIQADTEREAVGFVVNTLAEMVMDFDEEFSYRRDKYRNDRLSAIIARYESIRVGGE